MLYSLPGIRLSDVLSAIRYALWCLFRALVDLWHLNPVSLVERRWRQLHPLNTRMALSVRPRLIDLATDFFLSGKSKMMLFSCWMLFLFLFPFHHLCTWLLNVLSLWLFFVTDLFSFVFFFCCFLIFACSFSLCLLPSISICYVSLSCFSRLLFLFLFVSIFVPFFLKK